jgi:hypothetical protein
MRYIDPAVIDQCKPDNWDANAQAWFNEVASAANQSDKIRSIGNKWKFFKPEFINEFGDKCWYTEAPRIGTDNDVDHFRPKGGALDKDGKIVKKVVAGIASEHQGYWWLAYKASNYRYSCVFANRPRGSGGKREYFPLETEATRAWTPACVVTAEDRTLLDPCEIQDVQLIAFDKTPGEAVSRYSENKNKKAYERFYQTAKIYNLNEKTIKAARLNAIKSAEKNLQLLKLIHSLPANIRTQEHADNELSSQQELIVACNRKAPFSAAIVSLVSTLKHEPWFMSLLPQLDLSV